MIDFTWPGKKMSFEFFESKFKMCGVFSAPKDWTDDVSFVCRLRVDPPRGGAEAMAASVFSQSYELFRIIIKHSLLISMNDSSAFLYVFALILRFALNVFECSFVVCINELLTIILYLDPFLVQKGDGK